MHADKTETLLRDQYTLIECLNTLIEQSVHLATETRMSMIMGIID